MKIRVCCLLSALCMLLTCVVGMSSCTVEDIVPLLEEYASQTESGSDFVTTVEIDDLLVSDTSEQGSDEPVTLPGENTVAPDCAHQYGEWTVAKEAGCEEEGLQYRLCGVCNGRDEAAIPPTGHTEEDMKPVPPTCVLAGRKGGTQCAVCKKVLTSPTVLLAKGHPSYTNGHCTVCSIPVDGADGLSYLDVYNQSYGYEYLGTMEKGAARQELYLQFDEAVKRFHTDPSVEASVISGNYIVCSFDFVTLGLTAEEAQAVWKTYRDDNPLYYWLSNQVGTNEKLKKIYLMVFEEYADGETRMETNQLVYEGIAKYLSEVCEGSTDYEVALFIHDALIRNIRYAYDQDGNAEESEWAHSILGIFDGRGAVCEGIAKAYQLLLNFYDVDCLLVTGFTEKTDDTTGEIKRSGHAWNVVCIDGVWYGVDVTWDENYTESESYNDAFGIPYNFFCLSATEFAKGRNADSFEDTSLSFLYRLPALSEYGIEWVDLYKSNVLVDRYSSIDVAFAAMNDTDGQYRIKLYDGTDGLGYHKKQNYHIVGDLPQVYNLIIEGSVSVDGMTVKSISRVYLSHNTEMKGTVLLKKVILAAETLIELKTGKYELIYRWDQVYYSKKENIVLVQ